LKNINILLKKEAGMYFNTPIGYIFSSFFLVLIGFLFFYGLGGNSFWDMKVASMEQYFIWVPILFIIFIPAITMRLWSEEIKSGTIEVLMTLPIKDYEIVIAKFLSAWLFLCLTLAGSLLVPITVWLLGGLDWGIVISGYIGTLLMGGAYLSTGLVISLITRDQITAFVVTFIVSLVLFLMGYQPILQFFGKHIGSFLAFLAPTQHFDPFRMGLFDLRNVIFFFTYIALMLTINVYILRGKR